MSKYTKRKTDTCIKIIKKNERVLVKVCMFVWEVPRSALCVPFRLCFRSEASIKLCDVAVYCVVGLYESVYGNLIEPEHDKPVNVITRMRGTTKINHRPISEGYFVHKLRPRHPREM